MVTLLSTTSLGSAKKETWRFFFVDLAGSERITKTDVMLTAVAEAKTSMLVFQN